MNNKTLGSALSIIAWFILLCLNGMGQTKEYKQTTFQQNTDVCFTKTLVFLHENNYFIESTDKASGFIKAKTFSKNSKLLSAKAGERTFISFLFVPDGSKTRLLLNIYAEDLNWGGSTQNRVISVEDKGVIDDPAPYQKLISDLTSQLQ
ncbi:hypothetical protein [Mucilaginibacter auburnensis]|uniref:Uncharacterized protein n=1 Tax=Mucilaginibacter auburnensis TaxID=1457233 RepID=A0A2H9VN13_9SPHI|nr:hypothetical protein [Mucilaginibacter auburnensis]PJJ79727.1 hypothetical protein CLV57_2864 [Mucilaginibacter auburnensis]